LSSFNLFKLHRDELNHFSLARRLPHFAGKKRSKKKYQGEKNDS